MIKACTGCGSTKTIEELRQKAGVLSCCPERKFVPLVDAVIEHLQGTTKSLEDVAEFFLDDDNFDHVEGFYDALDQEIFLCQECALWCEQSEMTHDESNHWTCTDCNPDLDD